MSAPNYRPVSNFAPAGEDGPPIFQSPEMMARPWQTNGGDNSHLSGIEMQQNPRPDLPPRPSQVSFASDGSGITQKPNMSETAFEQRPFLRGGPHKSTSMDSTVTTASFKAKTGRQLGHLLIGSSVRWIISLLLCAAWVLATRIVHNQGAVTEIKKRIYNTATTGTALALGLNIASAFKDMALNMRWPILASRERNLVELDLILRADSLTQLAKLVFRTRRVPVIIACLFWLALNIAAQAAIAAVSLTYGFEADLDGAILKAGNTSAANMQRFYPLGTASGAASVTESFEDQSYTAHLYGSFAPLFGYNTSTELPEAGKRVLSQDSYVYYNNDTNVGNFVFFDENVGAGVNTISIFTSRTINATYECEAHEVTSGGNGTAGTIEVANIGTVTVSQALANATTFFNNDQSVCPHNNNRCAVIEVLETSDTQPWYYKCNITLGQTQGDSKNLSWVSDEMAYYATASIAQGGFVSENLQTAQIFPQNSIFGSPARGDKDVMGVSLGYYALGAIQGCAIYNPKQFYQGTTPSQGQQLSIGHSITFVGLLALLLLFQLVFIVIVAVWANRVKVGEDTPIGMSVMMRPIADKLDDIGHGKETREIKRVKRRTLVKYEKDPISGVWSFKMKTP